MNNNLFSILIYFITCFIPIFAVAFYNEGPTWIHNYGGQNALILSSFLLMSGLFALSLWFSVKK